MEVVHLIARDNKISYHIAITSKYTFIRGDSATGKTTLLDLIELGLFQIDNGYVLRTLNVREDDGYTLLRANASDSKTIFYADEDYSYIHTLEFQKLMQASECLFIIINRKEFKSLAYATTDLLTFNNTERHEVNKPYASSNFPVDYSIVKYIMTEDSSSGLYFFNLIKEGVESTGGNSSIVKLIEQRRNTLFILDALGAGSIIKTIVDTMSSHLENQNQLLLLDSFEAMVLKSEFLKAWVAPPINCSNKEQYATQLLIKVMSDKGSSYAKSRKNPCLAADCCFKTNSCYLFKDGCKQQLIAGPIYDKLKSI